MLASNYLYSYLPKYAKCVFFKHKALAILGLDSSKESSPNDSPSFNLASSF